MFSLNFCTTLHKQGYEEYGHLLIEKYKNLPDESKMFMFLEDFEIKKEYPNIFFFDIFKISNSCKKFVSKHKNNYLINENKVKKYKKDYLKFCYKVFAIYEASKISTKNLLIWIDSDILIKKKIDKNILDYLCNGDFLISYLNREKSPTRHNQFNRDYSETGIMVFNLNHKFSSKFFLSYINWYINEKFVLLEAWDDTCILDNTIYYYEKKYGIKNKKLSNGYSRDPIRDIAILNNYFFHPMGKNKFEKLKEYF